MNVRDEREEATENKVTVRINSAIVAEAWALQGVMRAYGFKHRGRSFGPDGLINAALGAVLSAPESERPTILARGLEYVRDRERTFEAARPEIPPETHAAPARKSPAPALAHKKRKA